MFFIALTRGAGARSPLALRYAEYIFRRYAKNKKPLDKNIFMVYNINRKGVPAQYDSG